MNPGERERDPLKELPFPSSPLTDCRGSQLEQRVTWHRTNRTVAAVRGLMTGRMAEIDRVLEAETIADAVKVLDGIAVRKQRTLLSLTGEDGNAFAILARARKAAMVAGWTKEEIDAYTSEATSGDYDKLLTVTCKMFEVT